VVFSTPPVGFWTASLAFRGNITAWRPSRTRRRTPFVEETTAELLARAGAALFLAHQERLLSPSRIYILGVWGQETIQSMLWRFIDGKAHYLHWANGRPQGVTLVWCILRCSPSPYCTSLKGKWIPRPCTTKASTHAFAGVRSRPLCRVFTGLMAAKRVDGTRLNPC
jgi:hypothetical protein